MESQAALEKMNKDYPFVRCPYPYPYLIVASLYVFFEAFLYSVFCCSMNCIVNHYTVWTDDTMIAIAEDRFEGMQNELSIPTRWSFKDQFQRFNK